MTRLRQRGLHRPKFPLWKFQARIRRRRRLLHLFQAFSPIPGARLRVGSGFSLPFLGKERRRGSEAARSPSSSLLSADLFAHFHPRSFLQSESSRLDTPSAPSLGPVGSQGREGTRFELLDAQGNHRCLVRRGFSSLSNPQPSILGLNRPNFWGNASLSRRPSFSSKRARGASVFSPSTTTNQTSFSSLEFKNSLPHLPLVNTQHSHTPSTSTSLLINGKHIFNSSSSIIRIERQGEREEERKTTADLSCFPFPSSFLAGWRTRRIWNRSQQWLHDRHYAHLSVRCFRRNP